MWKDCGYLSLTKKGNRVRLALKRQYYVLDLAEVKEVLDGKRAYTLVYEPVEGEKPLD